MKIFSRTILAVLAALPATALSQTQAQAQGIPEQPQHKKEMILPRWNIKTNLLYDATTTLNLGVEFRTGSRTSIDVPFNYNPWTFSGNRKLKHALVQPEFRLWTRRTFDGHFVGVHAHYAYYNVGNLPHGPFSEYMRDHRFEGWLAGAGVSYGYRWNFNHWLGLEATIGAGYAYLDYEKFECHTCGDNLGHENKHYFGPTKVGVSLIFGIDGKPAPEPAPAPVLDPMPVYIPQPKPEPAPQTVVVYEPVFAASFITPEVETVKARSESGKAYLDFAVGRSEIISGFKNNASELEKIRTTVESVQNDPDATITGITIVGYASPEGSAESNRSLSERRAQALRTHIGSSYGLYRIPFNVWGAGEDWNGLETLVENSFLPQRERILSIIGSFDNVDARERNIAALAGGEPYRRMKTELYPQLRRVEYQLDYTVVPFTVEQGKEVMKTRPGSLSLNEMFLIANTYPTGSDAFIEVFETAARVFPDSDIANLNAASSAIGRKDAVSAAGYLAKVKEQTPVYWNNAGIVAWLEGDKVKAAACFAKAGEQGSANAAQLAKHLESYTTPNNP